MGDVVNGLCGRACEDKAEMWLPTARFNLDPSPFPETERRYEQFALSRQHLVNHGAGNTSF
ncbi:MAG TPA: hypothetical protein VMR17_20925 [Xanthobacteraceae bacterium]|jgi:hypothetical protein|nr:hypothetical protein [Xanthobacteraceae bacterium]